MAMGNVSARAAVTAIFSITLVGLLTNVVISYVIAHDWKMSFSLLFLNLTVILIGSLTTIFFAAL